MRDLENYEWRKSSFSGGGDSGQDCVEVTVLPDTVGVRDTTDRAAGYVTVSRAAWSALIADA